MLSAIMKSVRRAEQCTWQVLYHSPVHIHCIAATENSSEPLSAKILNPEDIHAYNCDEATKKKLWQHLNPPEDFRHTLYGENFRTLLRHFYRTVHIKPNRVLSC